MIKQQYIKSSSILRVIHSMINKETYFNSENHFIIATSAYLGLSPKCTKLYYNQFKEEGILSFDNQQVKSSLEVEEIVVPQYILSTQKIKDKGYWLRQREYEILCYLDNKRNQLHYIFSNEEIKGINETLYLCAETIAKDLEYTVDQIRTSLRKINFWFEGFWKNPNKFESRKRYHKNSRSKTISLPKRKLWKRIIEDKVLEITGLFSSDLVLPVLIDKVKKKQFDKKKESYGTLVTYSNVLTHNKKQIARLKEGDTKLKEIKAEFMLACIKTEGYLEITEEDIEEVRLLLKEAESSKKERYLLLKKAREKLSPYLIEKLC